MKRYFLFLLVGILLASMMVLVALNLSIPLAIDSDFQVLYYTTQGLLNDVDIYDQENKIQMMSEIHGVPLNLDYIPQFAYPPWFALSTVYLGLFSIQAAAVLWFEINLLMLFLSIWFLTDNWKPTYRLLAFPATFLFFPVLGMLVVGQYDLPVLLGISMLIYSLKHKQVGLAATGMAFLTFKPHLGGLILLAGLIHLFLRRDHFGKRVLIYTIVIGIFLFAIGFLADSLWPVHYFNSLLNYRGLSHITSCSECANLSVWLSRWYNNAPGLSQASVIGGVLLIILTSALIMIRPPVWKYSEIFLTAVLLVTMIALPYLYNYDYILLLIPFAVLADKKSRITHKIIVAFCCLLPSVAIVLYARDGNISLLIATVVITILLYFRFKSSVDFPEFAS